MKINEILSISYGFDKCEKDTCVNSSGMNAILTFLIISNIKCKDFNSYDE